jgi:hypothetical protein
MKRRQCGPGTSESVDVLKGHDFDCAAESVDVLKGHNFDSAAE